MINQGNFKKLLVQQLSWIERVSALEDKHGTNILSLLKEQEKNLSKFQNMITEINFGFFLDSFCENLKFSPVLGEQTPDWQVIINGQTLILEVATLHDPRVTAQRTAKDLELGKIAAYWYKEEPERLIRNVLEAKTLKYQKLLIDNQFPFILGVFNTPLSGVRPFHTAQILHGKSNQNLITGEITVDRSQALFFSDINPTIRNLLNGVLWVEAPSDSMESGWDDISAFRYWLNDLATHSLEPVPKLLAIAVGYD